MAADQQARPDRILEDLPPHRRGERVHVHHQLHRDRSAVRTRALHADPIGNEHRPGVALGLQALHRVQHAALGVGRLQVDRLDQGEQRRAVGSVELIEQRQVVVAVIGRHRLVRGRQSVQAAGLLQSLQHQAASSLGNIPGSGARARGGIGARAVRQRADRIEFGGCDRLADAVQNIAEHAQQAFGLGPVRLPQGFQLVAALLVDRRDPLAEHGDHVVPHPGPHRVQQAHDQCEALVLIQHLPQVRDIGDPRLSREMRDLPRRDPLQPRLGRPESVQFPQERQTTLELVERRRLRHVLQTVVRAAPGDGVDQQQPASLTWAPASTRLDTSVKNPRFTSVRIFLVISSSVV